MALSRCDAGPASAALLRFVSIIHSTSDLDDLADRYVAAIPSLITANCYGIYRNDPSSGVPLRMAVQGGVQRFVDRWEESGFECDPLRTYVAQTGKPAHDGILFSEAEWQNQPFRETLRMRRLARMMEAPLVAEGELVGGLYFTRSPDDPPFKMRDLHTLDLVTEHVALAMGNSIRYSALEERYLLMEAALHFTGAAILLTDEWGEIRFMNRQADELFQGRGREAVEGGELPAAVRENAVKIHKGARSATVSLRLASGRRPETLLVLRTVRLPGVRDVFASFVYQQGVSGGTSFDHLSSIMSTREIQVIELLSQGLQNKEIASKLFVSPNTVKYHLKQIYQTLQVGSRAELLMKATSAANRPAPLALESDQDIPFGDRLASEDQDLLH
jgi:DNA-binding CsgD family transcriptional regulator/GAF domain-containing protein